MISGFPSGVQREVCYRKLNSFSMVSRLTSIDPIISISNALSTLKHFGNCWCGLFEPLGRAYFHLAANEDDRSNDESHCLDEIDVIAVSL